jgi:hypothetical protein
MPDYRRAHVPGGTYFFTVNTYRRQTFLTDADVRSALREAIGTLRSTHPFANELARTRALRSLRVFKVLPLEPKLANSRSNGSKLEIPPTPIRQ